MKNAPATEVNEGAKTQRHITNPRQRRLLQTMLERPVTRKEADAIAHASNGPNVVFLLRSHGVPVDTQLVKCRDYDGNPSHYGLYSLARADKPAVREMLREVAK